ncbi:MAG: DUF3488 domain-containing protein [Deltaproteobacteria bacterium]|nr:DUF3488 domain-containing protein [Deltaproteobacteria bacterium]
MTPGQRFVLAQRLCFAAIASLGFWALALGGELGLAGGAAAALAVAGSLWHRRPRLPDRAWLAVQVGFLAWLAAQWAVGGTHVLSLFGSLLVFVQVHRLLTRRRTRDDLYCTFIAFGQLLLASVLTVDAMFFVVFMAFVFFVIQGLLLSRMALSAEAAWDDTRGAAPGPRPDAAPVRAYAPLDRMVRLRLVAATTALAALIQVGTLLLFFILPRAQAAMLSGLVNPLSVSGFSDKVRLGSVGTMQLSRDPVMRVRAWGEDGQAYQGVEQLYFRGLALDRFDGRGWELADDRRTSLSARGGYTAKPPPKDTPWSVHVEVTLEPLDTPVLFHVARSAGIYGDFTQMEAVETDGFYVSGPPSRRAYSVYADPATPSAALLRSQDPATAPEALLASYTQLPESLSPRIAELAGEWSQGAQSPLDRVLLLQEKLKSFDYSLDQEPSRFPDPLLAFLDDVQEGHCEYFASGLAVMLRTQGVPSRIVNGFAGAEWNPVGEYWVVRQMHAHSWVEVWFPQAGWVIFDPTPTRLGGLQEAAQLTLLGRLRAWSDVGTVTWGRVMLDYGLDTQIKGLRKGIASLGDLGTGRGIVARLLPGPPDAPTSAAAARDWTPLWLLGLSVAAVLGLVALRRLTRPRGHRARRLATQIEERLLRRLPSKEGSPRPTLLVLARHAAALDEARFGTAPTVVLDYYGARFGGDEVTAAQLNALARLARLARRWRPSRVP